MEIKDIFYGVDYKIIKKGKNNKFNDMYYDSREVKENDIFVALIGSFSDGHSYIKDVIKKGASMVIVEKEDVEVEEDIWIIYVKNLRKYLGKIASNFYNHPQDKLKILAVTGTNGKTTTTYILESLLENTSRVGTTGYRILDKEYEAKNTTPESLDLIKLMKESVNKGVEYFIMEVSSHAICMGRVGMIKFDGAIFTNLTQDHLDYHNSMEEYFEAKAKILDYLKDGARLVINKDDPYAKRLIDRADSFSLKENADITGKILRYNIDSMEIEIEKNEEKILTKTKLLGKYNLQNLLGAIQLLCNLGYDFNKIVRKIPDIKSIPGRFEIIENNRNVMVIVDYAHTPDGLENILKTLKEIKMKRLVTLFGAGGDRDKTKRPKMANVVSKYSDFVYITSDNPRTEDPELIVKDVEEGIVDGIKYVSIVNREEAIKNAIESLEEKDILLIAGKGHEDYQIIGRTKYHFDDREIARKYLGGK